MSKRGFTTVGLLIMVLVTVVALTACASGEPPQGAKPGSVWPASESGLPTLYVFSDPS